MISESPAERRAYDRLLDVVSRTVSTDMRNESRYLHSHARARAAIKDVLEAPDEQIDRIIRSVQTNEGVLTNALSKELPVLKDEDVWGQIVAGVKRAFGDCAGSR